MEFGRDKTTDISTIDYSLPLGDDSILPGIPDPDFKFYLGTGKNGKPEWCGNLYPERLPDKERMLEYGKHFNFLELNGSFYNVPTREVAERWANAVRNSPGFKFTPKICRTISHIKRLKGVDEETQEFIDFCKIFGDALGPAFIQAGDNFSVKNFQDVEAYLLSIPEDFRLNIELRHESWFQPEAFKRVTDLLEDFDIGLVITDTNLRRDALHMHLTNGCVHIRFNGNNNHITDRLRLEQWNERILAWKSKGVKDVYFALHQPDDATFHESVKIAKDVFSELLK
ncbi:DUF72 domain-containing protein [Pedobacter sp. P351]|uniref:DUF72 domain-containing protein n=1 Tax=Pedobacter superstes TaxID=3133441 RepID=UPI0030A951B2